MMFFDAHCHWGTTDGGSLFQGAGNGQWMCAGTHPTDWESLRLAHQRRPGMSVAYGMHPWMLHPDDDSELWMADLHRYLEADAHAAVGEIGLDFAMRGCLKTLQRDVFRAQLCLASALRRVAVIHCVRAWGALQETLDEVGPLPRGFVLHAYRGSAELILPLARQGAYFSFKYDGGDRRDVKAATRVQAVPPERLLLESDLNLADCKDVNSYRERLTQTAIFLATATGTTSASVARQTFANAVRCFQG